MARLAVSMGCPCGIGPEVSVVAASRLAKEVPGARAVLVGDYGAALAAAKLRGLAARRIVRVATPEAAFELPAASIGVWSPAAELAAKERAPGRPGRAAGRAQLRWVDAATDLVAAGRADALVTGPVSKDAIARSGAPGARGFLGHTEHLAARLGAEEVTMAFHAPDLGFTASLVTTHLRLSRVPPAITIREVARATYWTARFVAGLEGGRTPTVAIAALNPHAGEHGLLGDEESTAIAPGIAQAARRLKREHIHVTLTGPVPAETAFRVGASRGYAAVVAMYHDQATIPMKILGFGESVNVSLGLPIVRTSVDHGTAYDRAGRGTADARGMLEAMKLATAMRSARSAADSPTDRTPSARHLPPRKTW